MLAVSAGTLGALASCGRPEDAIDELAASAAAARPSPTAPATPVLQHGPPALEPMTPPDTVVAWVPDTPPLVALTIDDGVSSAVVAAYTALARATGIRLTFFANGTYSSWTENAREMQPLVESGQVQIANHTFDHPDLCNLSDSQIADQLDRNNKHLQNLFGVDTRPYFRPPFMSHNDWTDSVCVGEGYSVIAWWTGTLGDASEVTAEHVRQNAEESLRAGNIVIGHANFAGVTAVFDDIIELIADRGLITVTLADVFATSGA